MNIQLVFNNTGDSIPFLVEHNHDLVEFFITTCNQTGNNRFSNSDGFASQIGSFLTQRHWAVSKSNEVLPALIGYQFDEHVNLENYLDQRFLNKQHADWVSSQNYVVDIDDLRFSENTRSAKLGNLLHNKYPDEIRKVRTAPALQKLGYIFPYEEVNMSIHRLETAFNRIEYSSENKWDVFENPFVNTIYSSNDISNLSFSYTYVGRQYYDKFCNFDMELENSDNFNYETLEFSFHVSLANPETIPHSNEFTKWAAEKNVKLVTSSLPIANIPNLFENLFEYRKMIYRNALAGNTVSLEII